MSATNRSNARAGHQFDYYRTPIQTAQEAFNALILVAPMLSITNIKILDPCAGGDKSSYGTYTSILSKSGFTSIDTIDIREDSTADIKADYLTYCVKENYYDLIISNPPYTIAEDFIHKALQDVKEGGYVSYLLRLNFLGSQKRKKLFDFLMPNYCFVHSKRPSFTNDGKTDGTEYATFVWRKGYTNNCCITRVV